jgi:hypothetical protein
MLDKTDVMNTTDRGHTVPWITYKLSTSLVKCREIRVIGAQERSILLHQALGETIILLMSEISSSRILLLHAEQGDPLLA